MHVEEEVELTIQTHVPDMQAGTRAQMEITEKISSIVAIAFDESDALIKKVDAILTNQNHETHSGTLKIKVPKRTRTIHFLGNYTKADITDVTTLDALNALTTDDNSTMRYWGKATYNGGNNLSVTLYRNMAKLTLTKGENLTGSCYIAGFVNRNLSGTVVPNGYAVGDTPTIPNGVMQENYTADNALGNVYYLFDHANDKNNGPLYVIIEFRAKYYKVAFAAGDTYFPIVRNRAYEINVTEPLDEMYAEANYNDAVNSTYPINDLVITSVPMTVTASSTEVLNQSGQTCTVTITIPEGITELNVPTSDAFTIAPTNGLTAQNGKYTVTQGDYVFTLTVKEGVTAGDKTISFSGRGKYCKATGSVSIELYDNVSLTVAADPATIYNTAGSTRNVTVSVPEGITTLTIPNATSEAFIVTPQNGLSANNEGSYSVTAGDYVFTLALRTDAKVGDEKTVTFNGSGQYKRATGSTTLTLEETPEAELLPVYELWVENSAWNGSTNYGSFFTRNGDISTDNSANLESTFYDALTVNETTYSADNHKSQHMVMGQNNSISFTIPEGDTRYLTLLVASNNGNTPSINLQKDGEDWTTNAAADATMVDGTYNFGNGEIGTNGRLIRYELPAGTYTLQGSSTSYLLYYLRVSAEKPTMTDIVQPQASDYALSWSGGEYGNYIVDPNDASKYYVDEDATTFTATLSYTGLSLTATNLYVATTIYDFEDNTTYPNSGTPSTTVSESHVERTYNTNEPTLEYNAGTYSLSGTASVTEDYKYAAFYEYAQLKAVEITVKNTVKVGLYDDWYSNTPVSEWTDGGKPFLIGFKMPTYTMPTAVGTDINFAIGGGNWIRGTSGLGIDYSNASNYRLTSQTENDQNNETISYLRTHPRTEWTYRIGWESVAAESLTVTTTDTDVYFSHNGTIGKSVEVATAFTGTTNSQLDIALDFYASLDGNTSNIVNRDNNVYDDLLLKTSRFYLKVTIPEEDAIKYNGQQVQLQGSFSGSQYEYAHGAINWNGSKVSGDDNNNIKYSGNTAAELYFDVLQGVTEYQIEWVFQTGQYYPGSGDILFTYSLVNNQGYNVTGDTQATIAFTNEPEAPEGTTIWSGSKEWTEWSSTDFLAIYDHFLPIGTEIIINTTSTNGGAFEIHDCEERSLLFENVNYPATGDNYYNVGSGNTSHSFIVTNNTTANDTSIDYGVNGLRINGNNVTITSVVVKFPNKTGDVINRNFDDGKAINGWGSEGYVIPTNVNENGNGYLALANSGGFAQAAIDDGYEPGNYTLTLKIMGTTSGSLTQVFQHFYTPKDGETQWVDATSSTINFGAEWQTVELDVTLNRGCNRFMFTYTDFTGTIYIDDLKLVRN